MTDYTLNLVDAIISGRATDIESAFQEAITDKISIAMESKRTSMAQSMFTKESVDAYELHDPKHPHFVKNHTKWKKSNPNGTTDEFISHMKTKRFNVDEELTLEDYSVEEFELDEAVTARQLIDNHNSSDHGGAQHFSNVDGKHHSWNYVKKNKEGTKYEVTTDKGEAEGIAHKGKFLKIPK